MSNGCQSISEYTQSATCQIAQEKNENLVNGVQNNSYLLFFLLNVWLHVLTNKFIVKIDSFFISSYEHTQEIFAMVLHTYTFMIKLKSLLFVSLFVKF